MSHDLPPDTPQPPDEPVDSPPIGDPPVDQPTHSAGPDPIDEDEGEH